MATTYLNSPAGSGTDPQIATFSMWFKITTSLETDEMYLFSGGDGSSNNSWLRVQGTDRELYFRNRTSSSNDCVIRTNAKYRDLNGWYHVVLKLNSTLGTAADRATMYVNGQEVTSLASSTDMTQNNLFHMFGSTTTHIGKRVNDGSTGQVGNFLASHVHFCDGYAYDASYFGSTDTTTGEWKINTNPNVTYGSRGFFILKDGNSVTDASPNTNNFTVAAGTLTKTEDNPSNVFCTWNPNYRSARKDMTLTNGNTFISQTLSGDAAVSGTIAVSSGKYYWEQIIAQVDGTNAAITGGLHTVEDFNETPTDAMAANIVGMRSNGNVWKGTTDLGNFTAATYNGDIFGVGFDADNGSMYFWRNGSALNSGNAIITGMDMTKTWIPFGVQHGGARVTTSTNFGNGYFQTTAVSSAGTNASNNGIFEYDVPTGYTALSTKGLNL